MVCAPVDWCPATDPVIKVLHRQAGMCLTSGTVPHFILFNLLHAVFPFSSLIQFVPRMQLQIKERCLLTGSGVGSSFKASNKEEGVRRLIKIHAEPLPTKRAMIGSRTCLHSALFMPYDGPGTVINGNVNNMSGKSCLLCGYFVLNPYIKRGQVRGYGKGNVGPREVNIQFDMFAAPAIVCRELVSVALALCSM